MGRAKIVVPPPKDYVPEPLFAPPTEITVEEVIAGDWKDSNLIEEIVEKGPSAKELEQNRIAEEKHQEILRRRELEEKHSSLLAEIAALKEHNEQLAREKQAAEKAREDTILAARKKATEVRGNQLNIVKQRKPTIWSRVKAFLRRRRINIATVAKSNYEFAIIQQAKASVPKMLDEIEKMHEQLTILEELIAKYVERQKIKD